MFNLFKKKKIVEIYSPLDGIAYPLSKSPDPAFAEGLMGEGICIEPTGDQVVAPFDGEVDIFHTLHAAGCTQGNIELVIHVGMDTVNLKGEGFKALTELQGSIKQGQPLIEFNKDVLMQKIETLITPVIVVDKPENAVIEIIKDSGEIKTGELIMRITL